MVAHHDLRSVRDQDLRLGHSSGDQFLDLLHHQRDIKGNTIAQNIDTLRMAYSAGQCMQSELTIFIDDGMACISAALITDYDICAVRKRIYDLAFSFISPVCTDNCLYHNYLLTELQALQILLIR